MRLLLVRPFPVIIGSQADRQGGGSWVPSSRLRDLKHHVIRGPIPGSVNYRNNDSQAGTDQVGVIGLVDIDLESTKSKRTMNSTRRLFENYT